MANDLSSTSNIAKSSAGTCIFTRFLEAARAAPDAVAIEHGETHWTYHKLENLAARIATRFDADGLQSGDRIALISSPSALAAAFMLASFARGLVFVNLDANYPPARLSLLVGMSEPKVVYSDPNSQTDFETISSVPLILPEAARKNLVPSDLPLDRPACIFFSSGSTLAPKGILSRYSGIGHFLSWQAAQFKVDSDVRVAWLTALSFDVCLRDVLLPLSVGGTLCIPADREKQIGKRLFDWLGKTCISVCHVVPSLARFWMKAAADAPSYPGLKMTFFAGEPLGAALTMRWREHFPETKITNLYGPTETTMAKFFHQVDLDRQLGLHPCGKPLPDTRFEIVDHEGNLMAQGFKGEVRILTDVPSLGYLRPLNGDVNLFAEQPGKAPYPTGDLGYVDDDGDLVLCGRIDDQVKVNGVRLEPAMVAAAVELHPAVSTAVVLAHPDHEGSTRLTAFFETRSSASVPSAGALRQTIIAQLSMAVIPSDFIVLDEIPSLPNGKVDRLALKTLLNAAPTVEIHTNETDEIAAIRQAFCMVFGTDKISASSDFFSLGGTSLQAQEILLTLEEQLSVLVTPTDLLSYSTPLALGEYITEHRDSLALTSLPRVDQSGPFPLAPSQQRFFRVLHRKGNRNWANMFAIWPIPLGNTEAQVRQALIDLHCQHDALQLNFFFEGGILKQDTTRPVANLRSRRLAHDDEAGFNALKKSWAQAKIDILSEAVLQPLLVERGEDETFLFVRMHHLALDGSSVTLLKQNFYELMSKPLQDSAPDRFTFRDFTDWSLKYRCGPNFAKDRAYWATQFSAPIVHPAFASRSDHSGHGTCVGLQVALEPRLRERIKLLAAEHNVTPYIVYMAAFMRTLAGITQLKNILAASPLACRDLQDVRALVGNVMAVVPFVMRDSDASLGVLLEDLREQAKCAAQHHQFQYHEIADAMNLDWDGSRYPLTGLSLNYRPANTPLGQIPNRKTVNKGYDLIYDLLVMVFEHSDATLLEFQYRRDRLDDDETQAIQDAYLAGLEAFVSSDYVSFDAACDKSRLDGLRARLDTFTLPAMA